MTVLVAILFSKVEEAGEEVIMAALVGIVEGDLEGLLTITLRLF
jgi:hypothetical protein